MDKEDYKRRIEDFLLQACRETISNLGLVGSGKLLSSFEISVNDNMEISISAEDYYKFLDEGTRYIEPYLITEEIQKNSNFDRALEVIEEYYAELIEQSFENESK
jgi:hypothetical protein